MISVANKHSGPSDLLSVCLGSSAGSIWDHDMGLAPEWHEKGHVVRESAPAQAGVARLGAKLALLSRKMVVHVHAVVICFRPQVGWRSRSLHDSPNISVQLLDTVLSH